MKLLIVSHNLISQTTNMGKTLRSYFQDFSPDEVAQFYIHSEVPVDGSICRNYYRFTDMDALKSFFLLPNKGRCFGADDIHEDRVSARTDTGILASAYQVGRGRTAEIYLMRDLVWKLSSWNNSKLWEWVDDFNPDIIFLASGDYGFIYDIARTIADYVHKPLVVSCVDDFYLYNRNEKSLLGWFQHRLFLKTVYKTMERASALFVICPSMKKEYEKLFGKKCFVLHTSADKKNIPESNMPHGVVYLGNVGLRRNEQLAQMGRALKNIVGEGIPQYIDVYSAEQDPEKLKVLTEENGIRFHGMVSAEEVHKIMNESMAVIHTESFDEQIRRIVRFSVSTKIPDCMMNGPCLIAYGPKEVASISYLQENQAAYVITEDVDLESDLQEIFANPELRETIKINARQLAARNHSADAVPQSVRCWLEQICAEWGKYQR